MGSLINYFAVIPAQVEIQQTIKLTVLDSGLRENDGLFVGFL